MPILDETVLQGVMEKGEAVMLIMLSIDECMVGSWIKTDVGDM